MWRPAGRPVQNLQFPPRESQEEEEWSQNPADVRLELGRVELPPEPGRASRWQLPVAVRLGQVRGCREQPSASGANFVPPGWKE
jgi:hypothetical protein